MKALKGGPELDALLDHLRRTHGFDVTAYKPASLARRITKRMQTVGVPDFASYQDYLEVHPEEFAPLFNTILINVTGFFRDPPAWEYLETEIVPRILATKAPADGIRVWTAACASGEEAYSVAILFAEALGAEAFRTRVRVYATDLDEEALNHARQGAYTQKDLANVRPDLMKKYFEPIGAGYAFRKDLRRAVIFGRHDLIQDAPISRVDLLVCRNTLMYFNSDVQTRVLARFYFSLTPSGFLFLGKAEMLLTHTHTFAPVDLRWRVFGKVPHPGMQDRLLLLTQGARQVPLDQAATHVGLREAAFENDPSAVFLVDAHGVLAQANENARAWFGLATRETGRVLKDLEVSYRPVELRSLIEQASAEGRPVAVKGVSWTREGEERWLDVTVTPLQQDGAGYIGVKVLFTDVTRFRRLQEEVQESRHELETAYEELQSTNEELETTNEELQSTNEELETTNEELQSSNEELETMNEELQSTNEELETVNDELRQRSDEIRDVNGFLGSILTSLDIGVVVLDSQFNVRVWNRRSEELWGLQAKEATGQNFLGLDIGLPVGQLRGMIRGCLAGEEAGRDVVVDAVNRRGRSIQCTVTCVPLTRDGSVGGSILLMEEKATTGVSSPE